MALLKKLNNLFNSPLWGRSNHTFTDKFGEYWYAKTDMERKVVQFTSSVILWIKIEVPHSAIENGFSYTNGALTKDISPKAITHNIVSHTVTNRRFDKDVETWLMQVFLQEMLRFRNGNEKKHV